MNANPAQSLARVATSTPLFAIFTLVTLSQTGHLLEHVAQVVQIHILGLTGSDTRGIVGQFDIEWVHFIWNAAIVVLLGALLFRGRLNPWLVVATAIASWHLVEHDVIMQAFLATGIPGSPGLLASGGLIGGGLPLSRPDLHFLYNLAETAAVWAAYLVQLDRASRPTTGRAVRRAS